MTTEADVRRILKNNHHIRIAGGGTLELKKKAKTKRPPPDYSLFFKSLDALGIEIPVKEYRFHKTRKWRIDLFFLEAGLALEVEGGAWTNGRHNRPQGFLNDMDKYNEITIYGFHLLRATPDEMQNGVAVGLIERYFKERK